MLLMEHIRLILVGFLPMSNKNSKYIFNLFGDEY